MDDDVLERAKEICNSHMRIHIVTSTMEELIAETERLRSEREVWIKHCQENSQQAAHIQELEGSVCCGKQTWEATEERIDGLLAVVGMLNTEVYDTAGPLFDEKNRLVRMLRGMLEEAEHGTKNRR